MGHHGAQSHKLLVLVSNLHKSYAGKSALAGLGEIREAFRVLDRDGNGFISKQELGMAMRSLGYMPSEVELAIIMQRLDMDDEGGRSRWPAGPSPADSLLQRTRVQPHQAASTSPQQSN
ncbi:Calcium-binding protein 8 [Galemys pyrenaicus]|uniref:Calcium-binding protein 8 n=1 Tax=Galemys pyrenaicus TaxID=202257 RepID=A0A8J6DIT2_GALPY|nr:Calcium-binding protein 8 [Galemys pyrenaicus]